MQVQDNPPFADQFNQADSLLPPDPVNQLLKEALSQLKVKFQAALDSGSLAADLSDKALAQVEDSLVSLLADKARQILRSL